MAKVSLDDFSEVEKKELGRRFFQLEIYNKYEVIQSWIADGASEKDIYKRLGVSTNTWQKWKRFKGGENDLTDAIKKGREITLGKIENEMYKSALPRYVKEWKEILDSNGIVRKVESEKWVAGNPTLMMFILQNRYRDRWKHTSHIINETTHKVKSDLDTTLDNMDEDDLIKLISKLDKGGNEVNNEDK